MLKEYEKITNICKKSKSLDIVIEGDVSNTLEENEIGIYTKGHGIVFKKMDKIKKEETKEEEGSDSDEKEKEKSFPEDGLIVSGVVQKAEGEMGLRIKCDKGIVEFFIPELVDYFDNGDEVKIVIQKKGE